MTVRVLHGGKPIGGHANSNTTKHNNYEHAMAQPENRMRLSSALFYASRALGKAKAVNLEDPVDVQNALLDEFVQAEVRGRGIVDSDAAKKANDAARKLPPPPWHPDAA